MTSLFVKINLLGNKDEFLIFEIGKDTTWKKFIIYLISSMEEICNKHNKSPKFKQWINGQNFKNWSVEKISKTFIDGAKYFNDFNNGISVDISIHTYE